MSQSVFCQTGFPKKAVIDNDTVCILSIEQTKTINKVFVDRDECIEMKDSLNSQINTYDRLVIAQKHVIASQSKEIDIGKNIILEKNIIIDSDDKQLKQLGRKVGWLKVQRTVFAIVAILASTIVGYEQIGR